MNDRDADPLFSGFVDLPKSEQSGPDFSFETAMAPRCGGLVAGTDEAGRGPLAGPVVAAAVILPPQLSAEAARALAPLNDSKKLSKKARQSLFDAIHRHALAVSVASASAQTVDEINILQASMNAMTWAVDTLAPQAHGILVDGNKVPPNLASRYITQAIIGGDGRSMSIAAASIIAKVTRDRMMVALGARWPIYGLERHAGYGALAHRDAIKYNGGIVRVHRFTFRPLRKEATLFENDD